MSRSRAARLVAVAALALGAGAAVRVSGPSAFAQGEPPLEPPRELAVKQAKRVLDALVGVLEATSKNDGKPALKALSDPSWAVRTFAAVRLGALGLDPGTVRALRDASHPGSKPLAATDPAVAAAEKFLAERKPGEPPSDEPPTPADEGVRIYGSLVRTELSIRKAPPAELVKVVLELPAFSEAAADARARGFVARELLAIGETDRILKEIGAANVNAAVEGDGKKVYEWFRTNGTYLFFHPGDHGVRLDAEARSAGVPTQTYREKTPWKSGEGPEGPASAKGPKDIK